jgi:hypothetical protein
MSKFFRILALGAVGALLVATLAATASADNPRPQRGDVTGATPDTYNAGWVTGVSRDGGVKGQSIKLGDHSTDASDFAFYSFREWWDQSLDDVTKIRASFLADAGTVNAGGSPRISVEVYDGVGSPTDVIYLDPAHCGNAAPGGWVDSDFTGDRTDCSIFDSNGTEYVSGGNVSAWDKLVADPYYDGKFVYFAYAIQDATTGANFIDRIFLDSALLTSE